MAISESEKKLIGLLKKIVSKDQLSYGKAISYTCRDHQLTDDLIEYIEKNKNVTVDNIMDWLFDEKDGQVAWYPAELDAVDIKE